MSALLTNCIPIVLIIEKTKTIIIEVKKNVNQPHSKSLSPACLEGRLIRRWTEGVI
jgi:hypothetical protein